MAHVVSIVTHPITARYLMRGRLGYLREQGHRVTLVTSPGEDLEVVAAREGVEVEELPMAREPAPARDLRALVRLWWVLRRLRPDVVDAGTPKAGLLGMVAARLAGVPVRIYTLRGLRLETTRGWKRRLLSLAERVASSCAHRVLCVSPSLRYRVLELRLADPRKLRVLGSGSSNGVDAARFGAEAESRAEELRGELGLDPDTPVVGFVGRFTADKGIGELLAAFDRVRSEVPEARLLLVGAHEPGDPVGEQIRSRIGDDPGVIAPGFLADPAPWYRLMDVLAFPSRREGFPNAPLEAGAAGVPTVGFAVTGTVDAVVNGATGRLVPPGGIETFVDAIREYLEEPELTDAHGRSARARVVEEFRPERIWRELDGEIRELEALREKGELGYPWYPAWLERGFDLVKATGMLLALSPVLLAVALLVRFRLGSPVLFRQERQGYLGRPFTLLKFRTMRDERDEAGEPLPDEERLTSLGRFLRTTSLDELPELFNVLAGEMSLVGPRPLLMEYLALYDRRQARRVLVMPGITGWAQVNGRNALTWEEKFEHDVWYVENKSFWLDAKILAMTVWQVLRRRGIAAADHATMPRFRGSGGGS